MAKDPLKVLDAYEKSGKYTPEVIQQLRQRILGSAGSTFAQKTASLYRNVHGQDDRLRSFISTARKRGYWTLQDRDLNQAGKNLNDLLDNLDFDDKDEFLGIYRRFDQTEDAEFAAALLMNHPQVADKVLEIVGCYDNLYRIQRRLLTKEDKKKQKQKKEYATQETPEDSFEIYRRAIESLPSSTFEGLGDTSEVSYEHDDPRERLFLILREKVRQETFRELVSGKTLAETESSLDDLLKKEKGNMKLVYEDHLSTIQSYRGFYRDVMQIGFINPDFEHPATGERGVIPSIHQLIGLYHNLEEQRFGIFDDCGTGKTAIAALLKPLVEKKKKKEGNKVHGRTIIIGPKASSKAWKDGLEGNKKTRYFTERQNVVYINGTKTDAIVEEMKNADFVFVNFDQLPTEFKLQSGNKKTYEVLLELGYDNIIVDEIHESKNTRGKTKRGKITASNAVRLLVNNPSVGYVSLLTGTPMPDNLDDYANIYFMLRPDEFVEEKTIDGIVQRGVDLSKIKEKFRAIYNSNPRALYALVRKNSIRRRSTDVTSLPPTSRIDQDVKLSQMQNTLLDHIFKNHKSAFPQMRKATLDPRLVDPEVLQSAGLIGKVSRKDATKYQRLEELLVADDSPLRNNESVIIFSSALADGVTRDIDGLRQKYRKLGLEDVFDGMHIKPLQEELSDSLSQKLGRDVRFVYIDGSVDQEEREKIVNQLNNKEIDGVVCTIQAAGVSLNFSSATTAFFLDQHYSPAMTEQAEARIIRRGQEKETTIHYLLAPGGGALDYAVKQLIAEKSLYIDMALDSVALLDKEKDLLFGNDHQRLTDIFLERRGGISIDLADAEISEVDQFETKKVVKRTDRDTGRIIVHRDPYETTIAQEIRKEISNNPVGIWHDPDFVKKYADHFEELTPYILARAKVVDMVKRAANLDITFPRKLLADCAGQGILYSAFEDLEDLVVGHGFNVPMIVDRDFSKPMHELSPNPYKFKQDICLPVDSAFLDEHGKFDFVDNSSLSLLENRTRIRDYVLNVNAMLEKDGLLQLGLGKWYFGSEFFKGMEEAGFEPVVKSVRHSVAASFLKTLQQQFGQHYRNAFANKLRNSTFSIFRKIDDPSDVDANNFVLENPEFTEEKPVVAKEVKKKSKEVKRRLKIKEVSDRRERPKYTGRVRRFDPRTGLMILDNE